MGAHTGRCFRARRRTQRRKKRQEAAGYVAPIVTQQATLAPKFLQNIFAIGSLLQGFHRQQKFARIQARQQRHQAR